MGNGRTYTFNAWEGELAGDIDGSTDTITITDMGALAFLPVDATGYLVIDPESPTLREYIYWRNINGNTFENVVRGQEGSANGGQAHTGGVKMRAVSMAQMFEDLWDDLIAGDQSNATALSDHVSDAGDPHSAAQYLKKDGVGGADELYINVTGDDMTGDLRMGVNQLKEVADATVDADAPNWLQVTTLTDALTEDGLTYLLLDGSRQMTGSLTVPTVYVKDNGAVIWVDDVYDNWTMSLEPGNGRLRVFLPGQEIMSFNVGGNISYEPLSMTNHAIKDLPAGTLSTDAANVGQVVLLDGSQSMSDQLSILASIDHSGLRVKAGASPSSGGAVHFGAIQSGHFASIKGHLSNGSGNSTGSLTIGTRRVTTDGDTTPAITVGVDGLVTIPNLAGSTARDDRLDALEAQVVLLGGTI